MRLTEDEAIRRLNQKKDCTVYKHSEKTPTGKTVFGKTILFVKNSKRVFDLGNGSWGSIDFLRNYCGYQLMTDV